MLAFVMFKEKKDKEGIVIEGNNLNILSNPLTGELKIMDGGKCIFYTELLNIKYAYISDHDLYNIIGRIDDGTR